MVGDLIVGLQIGKMHIYFSSMMKQYCFIKIMRIKIEILCRLISWEIHKPNDASLDSLVIFAVR